MTKIYINKEGYTDPYLYPDEWKIFVCEDFDEKCVLVGNRNYSTEEKAPWYKKAKDLIRDLDFFNREDFIDEYSGDLPLRKIHEIYHLYEECEYSDDINFIAKVAEIQSDLQLEVSTIRGYSQGDWQGCIYIADSLDENTLQTYYFGMLTEIKVEEDDGEEYFDYIPDDKLWEMERGNLKEELKKYFGLDGDIKVFEGHKRQITDYKEI